MNKREYRLWRRRMRQQNREVRIAARLYEAEHGGTYNNDRDVTDLSFSPSTYIFKDNVSVNRTLKKGDFRTTTPYRKEVFTQRGLPLLYYQWGFYESSTWHPSGKGAKATDIPTASWWGGYTDSSSMRSKLSTASQSALLSKIVNDAPNWDVLTDLAEGKETVGLLRDTASKFIDLTSMVKRRDIMSIAKFFKVSTTKRGLKRLRRRIYPVRTLGGYGVTVGSCMSNLWMSYRYGFMPMIYSMQDAMIAFNASFAKGVSLTSQVTLGDSLFAETSAPGSTSTGYKATNKSSRSCRGSFRKKAYFNYTNSMLARLVGNPFATVARTTWELVPFSFVADWFVGIGDYLDNLQVDTLVPTSSVNVTEKGTTRLVNWFEPNGAIDGYSHTIAKFYGTSAESTHFKFERSVGSLSVPGIDLSQSWYTFKRSIDSACLLWQRFNKNLNEYVDPDSGLRYRVH